MPEVTYLEFAPTATRARVIASRHALVVANGAIGGSIVAVIADLGLLSCYEPFELFGFKLAERLFILE